MTIKIVVKNENQLNSEAVETLSFDDLLITIGSGRAATLTLADKQIAAEQIVIINENGHPLVINQGRGTFLNGTEIEQGLRRELLSGDNLKIGSYNLIINFDSANGVSPLLPESAAVTQKLSPADNIPPAPEKLEVNSFADILSSLRKDEDQFYFQVTDAAGAKNRLTVEDEEIVLGWHTADNSFSSDKIKTINLPQAAVRKDWGGITIYPKGDDAILHNDALLEAGARLRNGDKLLFTHRFAEAVAHTVTLVFCEPAALVELNAILPQDVLTSALATNQTGEITVEPGFALNNVVPDSIAAPVNVKQKKAKPKVQMYFGYFFLAEVLIMIFGIILTAALTYLLLEVS